MHLTQAKKPMNSYEFTLVYSTFLLTSIGLLMVYTASSLKGAEQFNDPLFFFRKQTLVAIVGWCGILGIRHTPIHWLKKLTLPLLGLCCFLLSLILVPGAYQTAGGATRWLALGPLRFQPAELAKPALAFFLAANLARSSFQDTWGCIASNFFVFSILAYFVMLQPDFGSTALLGLLVFAMLYIKGVENKKLTTLALSGGFLAGFAIFLEPYRLRRLASFLDPWDDIQQGGFQIIQSYLAFRNGSLMGTGFGGSRQKLFFLPEAHTDFVLSVVGEEMGLLGVLSVLGLFTLIGCVGFKVAERQKNPFYKHLAIAMTTLLVLQSSLNMGVAMGLLPTKGLTLPFLSSGASSLIVFLFCIAVLVRIAQNVTEND
ncbi:MAG: putative lipid II flippase FtsW [Oligoflexales bacterium]